MNTTQCSEIQQDWTQHKTLQHSVEQTFLQRFWPYVHSLPSRELHEYQSAPWSGSIPVAWLTCGCVVLPAGCELSDWSSWSECSATCGGGVSVRNKTILQEPEPGGQMCPSPLEQHMACNTNSCLPGKITHTHTHTHTHTQTHTYTYAHTHIHTHTNTHTHT